MKSFWRIIRYARPYRGAIVGHIFLNLLAVFFSLVSIGLIIPVLRIIFSENPEAAARPVYDGDVLGFANDFLMYEMGSRMQETGQGEALLYVCLWVILAFFFKNLFRYFALFVIAPMRNGITRDLRKDLHFKILNLPIGYFTNEKRKGDIISRMTADLKEIESSVLQTIETVFREPLMILGSLVILLWMSPQLTLFVFIMLPIVAFVITSIGKSLKRSSAKAQHQMGEILSHTEENISGLKIIKAFNAEESKQNLFEKTVNRYFNVMNRVLRKNDLASPLSEFLGASIMAVIVWYGGKLVISNEGFTPEEFIAYILFFYQIIAPSKALSKLNYQIQKGNAAGERVLEVLDEKNPIQDKEEAENIQDFNDKISFKNVTFSYQDEMVLKDINLNIEKGKMVALVGQSGSGKTTLTNLVPRFYEVENGQLSIDGKEIKTLKTKDLRALMGMVTQESLLFNESVFYNIALGKPDATAEEVERAARIANAHDFIKNLPNGYQTNIGDSGNRLSGGQKQRLSIARAVLKNPPILILDEATSALDTESEKLVQDALQKLMENRTSLVIAHRLSTIQHADEIVVMDRGQIAERGRHSELLQRDGIYKRLVEMQSLA